MIRMLSGPITMWLLTSCAVLKTLLPPKCPELNYLLVTFIIQNAKPCIQAWSILLYFWSRLRRWCTYRVYMLAKIAALSGGCFTCGAQRRHLFRIVVYCCNTSLNINTTTVLTMSFCHLNYVVIDSLSAKRTRPIPLLHTDVSVRACTSWRPFLITSKEKGVVAELLGTVAKQAFRTENICFKE